MLKLPQVRKLYLRYFYLSVITILLFFSIATEHWWLFPILFPVITCGYLFTPQYLDKRYELLIVLLLLAILLIAYKTTDDDLLFGAGYMLAAYCAIFFYRDTAQWKSYVNLLPILGLVVVATFLSADIFYLLFLFLAIYLGAHLLFYAFLYNRTPLTSSVSMVTVAPRSQSTISLGIKNTAGKFTVYTLHLLLVILVFILIPRLPWEINLTRSFGGKRQIGFSNQIESGTVSQMLSQHNVYFTVKTKDRNPYFKGIAFNHYNGSKWEQKYSRRETAKIPARFYGVRGYYFFNKQLNFDVALQLPQETYIIEEYRGNNIFFRGNPQMLKFVPDYRIASLRSIARKSVIKTPRFNVLRRGFRYTIWGKKQTGPPSYMEERWARKHFLQLPQLAPRVIEEAKRIAGNSTSAREIADKTRRYLHQRYSYSLDVDPGKHEWVDYFLFVSGKGYCSHFATAMAVFLRINDIPARVIGGFMAKRYDEQRQRFVVTNEDAHAWVEAYLPSQGWTHFEATPPQEDYLAGLKFWKHFYYKIRSFWFKYIVGFSHSHQLTMYDFIRQGFRYISQYLVYVIVFCVLWLLVLCLKNLDPAVFKPLTILLDLGKRFWLKYSPTPSAQLEYRFYNHMLNLLEKAGLERHCSETPYELAVRIASIVPALSAPVKQLTKIFCEMRFGHRTYCRQTIRQHLQQLEKVIAAIGD